MKDKNKLFKYFLLISIIIFIYVIYIVTNIDKIVDGYFLNEGSSPTEELKNRALGYIYPALVVHIASCIFFLVKKAKPRKVIYPIAVIVFAIILDVMGEFKYGGAWGWYMFFTFLPTIWIIAMSIEFGMKIDKKYEENENIVGE